MADLRDPKKRGELIEDAKSEISAMAKQGLAHPSSKPVIIGAVIGAVVGALVLDDGWFIGLIVGAVIALYQRLRK